MSRVSTLLLLLFLFGSICTALGQRNAHRDPNVLIEGTEKYVARVLAPPSNDDPCNATVLLVNASCTYSTFTNAQATASTGVPAPGCANYLGGDVWFKVTVPASGSITFDSNTGVMTDGGMAVYSGTCGSLTLIACDDDSSPNGFMPSLTVTGQTPGATLWIRFWEYGNDNNGTFQICASTPPAPPSNDNPCSATPLTVGTTCTFATYTNAGATGTTGVPAPGCASYSGGDVWFSITVPASGNVFINTETGVVTDGGMAVYSGTCASMTLITCDDDGAGASGLMPSITLTGQTPGSTLWIRFWEYGNDNNGTFQICANDIPPISNDNPCSAITLSVNTICNFSTYTNAGATATSGVPAPTCGSYSGGDVWFQVTVPATGTLFFDSETGVMTDGAMAVYSGTCGSLTQIACADDGSGSSGLMPSLLLTGQTPGTTLWVRFWEYGNNNNGTFQICVTNPTPPANDNCVSATTLTIDGGCMNGTTQWASLQGSETPSCITPSGGTLQSVWYRFNTGANTTLNFAWILTNEATCYPGIAIWGPYAPGGGCLPSGTPILCLDIQNGDPGYHSQLSGLSTNSDYLIQVFNRDCGGGFYDQFQEYCIGIYTPPANDVASGATQMSQCGYTYTGSNIGYSPNPCASSPENVDCNNSTTGTACGASTTGDDVAYIINNESWWYFCSFAAATWQVTLSGISNCTLTDPLNQGIQMSIFSGTPSNLTCIQSAPNPSYPGDTWTSSTFATTAGQCIYILVDGFAGDQCNYSFTLTNLSGGCVILPVRLISFNAEAIGGNKVKLDWITEAEQPNAPYLIERSINGIDFSAIGSMPSNNSPLSSLYTFIDPSPVNGTNYYRIRYSSENGSIKYSDTRTVYFSGGKHSFSLFPSITSDKLNILLYSRSMDDHAVIYNNSGSRLKSIKLNSGLNSVDVSSLPAGLYLVILYSANGEREQSRFIKR